MKVLVVGGAGYIGSHCVGQLIEQNHDVVVLDNLSMGHRESLATEVKLYVEDLGNQQAVEKILKDEQIEVVMHFAAFAYVGESVEDPLKYYMNNVSQTISLLKSMTNTGVNKFIFSSTCATYGTPEILPITEDASQNPINPYGQTKLDIENVLKALANAQDFRFASLRYFNAAGAAADGLIGEDHSPETHLIPVIFDTLLGKRDKVTIFGTDYPTIDGTCLRDYVHVDDLSKAHIIAMQKLDQPSTQIFCNLGMGKPYSVRQVINTVEKVTGLKIPVEEGPRREGDPTALYADPSKAIKELDWHIEHTDLESIVSSAWNWHKSHPHGYKSKEEMLISEK